MTLEKQVIDQLQATIAEKDKNTTDRLQEGLTLLAKYRSVRLQHVIEKREGDTIISGAFQGMHYPLVPGQSAGAAKLLGLFDTELQPALESLTAAKYKRIVCIGFTDPYYPIGLALHFTDATVQAVTNTESVQAACTNCAVANGVGERVRLTPGDPLQTVPRGAGRETLLFHEAGTVRTDTVDPIRQRPIANCDLVIEYRRSRCATPLAGLEARFKRTHECKSISTADSRNQSTAPRWLSEWDQFDRLLAGWDWKRDKSSWLICQPNTRDAHTGP